MVGLAALDRIAAVSALARMRIHPIAALTPKSSITKSGRRNVQQIAAGKPR
jgi:hypothetical protein